MLNVDCGALGEGSDKYAASFVSPFLAFLSLTTIFGGNYAKTASELLGDIMNN